ncbi:hypothetical protein EOD23_39485 [Mesorhizobium sp. USDA-HM6]|nr:hypothetical protein EOD23_39485 [Mesorhizobium sp. USDA-HM6]
MEMQNRSIFCLTQFRAENRFTLFLELLWRMTPKTGIGFRGHVQSNSYCAARLVRNRTSRRTMQRQA